MEQTNLAGVKANKKIIFSVVIVGLLVIAGALLYANGFLKNVVQKSDAGDCLVLAQGFCDAVRIVEVDAQGTKAAAFNLPAGTPIYMPFAGVFTDATAGAAVSEILTLTIPNTDSVVTMVGGYTSSLVSGATVAKGEQLAVTAATGGEAKAFNFVIYTEGYDLTNLFKVEPTPIAQ